MNILFYQLLAGIEFLLLVTLTVLIVKRKIGRPLTESELEERRNLKRQKELEKEQAKELQTQRWRQEEEKLTEQDRQIRSLARPVTFVSLTGDDFEGRTICVQDGNGTPHTFHAKDYQIEKICPVFRSLYSAVKGPAYYGNRGAVIFQ